MTLTNQERPGPSAGTIPPISEPYALFVCQNLEIDEQGRRWAIATWAKDLALHLDYLDDLTLVSPAIRTRTRSADTVSLDEPPFDRLKFIDLPNPVGRWQALKSLPAYVLRFWRAIGPAHVVHCGYAGWPFVQGWVIVPLARLRGRRKFILANVESSPWRAARPDLPWHRRWRSAAVEALVRATLRMADLKLLTSKQYLNELLPPGTPGAHVTPATWLNEEWILGAEEAVAAWDAKQGPVRLLFVGRLIPEKGVPVLLAAIEAATRAGADVELAIHPIRTSPWHDQYIAAARSLAGKAAVTVLNEIPYGDEYMALIRGSDAVMVPSLSDEQPRIAYDALSQAVPVIGSATGGIMEVVEPGVTGRLSPPKDVDALAESILWAGRNRPELRAMGLRGPASVRGATHQAMHRTRHRLLREALDARRELV